MPRRFGLFAFVLCLVALPGIVSARVDVGCGTDATSAVTGNVRNVRGDAISGVRMEARQANKETPIVRSTTTDAFGNYRLCVPHDTYDIRAAGDTAGLYAGANRSITTFTNFTGSVDFALEYKLNLTITPQASSLPTAGSTQLVTWTIRSKAPCVSYPANCTDMQMTLEHAGPAAPTLHPPFVGIESGGPAGGGWNVWRYTETLAHPLAERAYFATVRGFGLNSAGQIAAITELAIDPYLVDNQKPLFGPAGAGIVDCGGSHIADRFLPATTTNPWAMITVGVCDPFSSGGRSNLDPYSVSVVVRDPSNVVVTGGGLVLNQLKIQYLPSAPFTIGTWKFQYTIKDNAGNTATSGIYFLDVTNQGGSVPVLSAPMPGNLGQGTTLGIVAGSAFTTPSSRPTVSFHATDPDGQGDLSYGSLRVRIYGPDGSTLLYDYDPRLAPCGHSQSSCPANSGFFNQGTGRFEAGGFSLVGKPPGMYVASASISDHGGNSVSLTWRWILVIAT